MRINLQGKVLLLVLSILLNLVAILLVAVTGNIEVSASTAGNTEVVEERFAVILTDVALDRCRFRQEVADLTNMERIKAGLEPLVVFNDLGLLAGKRAMEARTLFSHKRPDGSMWYSILDHSSVDYIKAGENLACGFDTPTKVVNAWMKSESHRDNILNPDYTGLGVGFFIDANKRIYASQLFLRL